jgi:general stress protein YciG
MDTGGAAMPVKGEISVREAGRRGGNSTKKKYGGEFYQSIGKKGGETTKQRHGHEHYERIGRKGGETMKKLIAKAKRMR